MNLLKRAKLFVAFFSVFACLAVLFGPQVFASDPEEDDESPGIPAYSISRLKVLAGVAYSRTPNSDWQEATTNTPLGPNSRISVPDGSEAELQFHAGQFVLLTSGVDVEIPEMSEERTRFRIRAGEIRFDLPGDDFAPVSVRVPGGALARFDEPGRYWLVVTDEDTTNLVVRRGRATVAQEGETTRVLEGQQAVIGRNITVSQYQGAGESVSEPAPLTTQERDTGVPPVVTHELRNYGSWVYTSSYGYVWQPRVASGWSPYVYGRWSWVSPYGWTWIAYEPWGWYPYRTGYWVTVPGIGWAWTPYGSFVSVSFGLGWGYYHNYGYYHHRNFYYRPANARFIPDGRNIRWVPLQPGERYSPPQVRRNDQRLQGWNRALESNRVFMAQSGSEPGSRQWRDVNVVQAERQTSAMSRSSTASASRSDMRPVRPELMRSAYSADGTTRNSSMNTSRSAERTFDRGSYQGASPRSTGSGGATAGQRTTSPHTLVPSRDVPSTRERPGVSSVSPSHDSGQGTVSSTSPAYQRPSRYTSSPDSPASYAPSRSTVSPGFSAPHAPSRTTVAPSPAPQMPSRSTTVREAPRPSSVGQGSGTTGRRSGFDHGGGGFSRGGGGGWSGSGGGSRGGGGGGRSR